MVYTRPLKGRTLQGYAGSNPVLDNPVFIFSIKSFLEPGAVAGTPRRQEGKRFLDERQISNAEKYQRSVGNDGNVDPEGFGSDSESFNANDFQLQKTFRPSISHGREYREI